MKISILFSDFGITVPVENFISV